MEPKLFSFYMLLLCIGVSLSLAPFTYADGSPPILSPQASSPSYEEAAPLKSPSIPSPSAHDSTIDAPPPSISISINESTPSNGNFEAWTPSSSPKPAAIVKDESPTINSSSKSSPSTNDINVSAPAPAQAAVDGVDGKPKEHVGGYRKASTNYSSWQYNNHHYSADHWPNHPTTPNKNNNTWPRSQWPARNQTATWRTRSHWPPNARNQSSTWQRPYSPQNATRTDGGGWHGSSQYYWPTRPRGSSTSAWPPLPARPSPPCKEAAPPLKPPPHRWGPRRFAPHF